MLLKKRGFSVLILSLFAIITTALLRQRNIWNFVDASIVYSVTKRVNLLLLNHADVRIHQPISSTITRGVLIFYPHNNEIIFRPELLWLYHSWVEMMNYEPTPWRTDLIIYTEVYTVTLKELGCVLNRVRTDKNETPQCRVFLYQRISSRRVQDLYKKVNSPPYQQINVRRSILLSHNLATYWYIDSINSIDECYPTYSMYDYILRTDSDTFLTKNFGNFTPYNDTMLIGQGGYSTTFTENRLRRIAQNMNWLYANVSNLGSTWYGPPHIAQKIANRSMDAILYLAINEFTPAERQGKVGVALWPDWHYGVLLLYGCDLAINHLVASESISIRLAQSLLDQSTTNRDRNDIAKNNRLHLHCWHTNDIFSKFQFKAGNYNHIQSHTLINDTSPAGFALRIALESRLMSLTKLKQTLQRAKNSSNV
ncbi:unnamed protein product [Adineta ricciae]|uniref:DUF7164 domain-containing protein n=1 Tax=Adineta ricciae TaxID=249248 RepID=A0A813U6R2_ADIRI|nr:unnamed protein product [Adineta ricciae]CAF1147372.1 unnamed protein product [Adineta ricciae]